MKNRLTFANVIGILIENKKKTYPQYQLISDLFSLSLLSDHEHMDPDMIAAEAITYSRWCKGNRPIPLEIIKTYEEDNGWNAMTDDFENYIIPNLINEAQARIQMEELVKDSTSTIGYAMAESILKEQGNSAFFTSVVRYAILSDHNNNNLYSLDLPDVIIGNKLPSVTSDFVGRKEELKRIDTILSKEAHVFITGMAGIGKSELVKAYAHKNKKKYTNIIYIYYSGDLRKDISNLIFAEDVVNDTEDNLFNSHYSIIRRLHSDSLIIIDNFNVLPKDEPLLKDLLRCDFHMIITSRCRINGYNNLEIGTLEMEKELTKLFLTQCPSAKTEIDTISSIIDVVNHHTLTVCLAAKTLQASGLSAKELLFELKESGLSKNTNEVELYKDDDFEYLSMIGHLKELMSFQTLSNYKLDILMNLCLFPSSGILKEAFGKWLELENLNTVNELIRYGIISEDINNNLISLHPVIAEVTRAEALPSVSSCNILLKHLHLICLARGLDVRKPIMIIDSLKCINNRIIIDDNNYYLSFLQDMFPYFEKYGVVDLLPDIINRIELLMNDVCTSIDVCDKALLLDYKAWLMLSKNEYDNAIKKYNKAIALIEKFHNTYEVSARSANLLSNIYNNMSSALFLKGRKEEATTALKKAFSIRKDFSYLGIIENNDTIQQTLHMVNQLINVKDFETAENILGFTTNIVTEYLGKNNVDYATCMFYQGVICMQKNDSETAKASFAVANKLFKELLSDDYEYINLCNQLQFLS